MFQGLSPELVNVSEFTSGDLLSNPAEATSETDPRGYSPLTADPWQGARLHGRACSGQRERLAEGGLGLAETACGIAELPLEPVRSVG